VRLLSVKVCEFVGNEESARGREEKSRRTMTRAVFRLGRESEIEVVVINKASAVIDYKWS
jgi:hypothetical protein